MENSISQGEGRTWFGQHALDLVPPVGGYRGQVAFLRRTCTPRGLLSAHLQFSGYVETQHAQCIRQLLLELLS